MNIDIWVLVILIVLAVFGVVFLWLAIVIWWDERQSGGFELPIIDQESRSKMQQEKAVQYLDNEVRGNFRYQDPTLRGLSPDVQPTLKAKVDAIEKHLGISVEVKKSDQKIVTKKVKK